MARRRGTTTFSLSFLDIMSCGFGAVALLFLIIKHDSNTEIENITEDRAAEVKLLEEDIAHGQEQLVRARNTLARLDQEQVEAQGLARRVDERIQTVRAQLAQLDQDAGPQDVASLESELASMRQRLEELQQAEAERGDDVQQFVGQGQRQYLTGLKLGGARILILVDGSASMLDSSLVNIIRRRNMSDDVKRSSPKWQRTVNTVRWLTAQLPSNSNFQLYTFNTDYRAMVENTEGQWLSIGDTQKLEAAMVSLQSVVPEGGTSLENVFLSIQEFEQLPDNIYLITDGLPTQGREAPRRGTISGKDRERLFARAVDNIPAGIPINIILMPMEGDPMAAASFWKLAQATNGAFLTPSEDWP